MNHEPQEATPRQQLLGTMVLMGLSRIVVTGPLAVYKIPGVYVEEIPSGVNG